MTITSFHVNGPAIVYVGTGTSFALELLGYTDNGVDIQINENKAEIFSDVFGPMTPHDFQDMGATARIVAPFIATDRGVLTKIQLRGDHSGAPTSTGLINSPGIVLGQNNYYFPVAIASQFDVGWIFAACVLRPTFGTRLATKANPFRVEFLAWPYAPVTTISGKDTRVWTRGSVP